MTDQSEATPRRRRIAVVVPALADKGGVPTVALFIMRAIERRPDLEGFFVSLSMSSKDGSSVMLSSPRTWFRGVSSSKGTFEGRPFIHVGAMFGELEFQRLTRRRLLSQVVADADLIQVVAGTPAWACPVLGLGKPVVLQVATLVTVERRARESIASGLGGWWRKLMTRVTARLDIAGLRSDAIMVENPWMLRYSKEHTQGGEVVYAPPGVDTTLFHPKGSEPPPRTAPYILSVGRFSDVRKNAKLLLAAYSRLVAARPDAPQLVLAGFDGPDDAFWSNAKSLGLGDRIHFVEKPSQLEVAALYRHALCFALASDEEGFGMVVIEAMASGVPVVSTRSGGPDGIITDGVDGFLVDRDDADAMADRLGRLVSDPDLLSRMAAAAHTTAVEQYSEEVAGDRYLAIYDRLMGGR